ncbi:hypothetical protein [Nocardia sp. NPDC052566]|uniref:hypothetical protein n=1 Tax=Nocardia sp. NPDC052566 TaxID=3364330 RepID=UPI0037CAAF9A
MRQRRWISRSTLAIAGVAATAALTACGSSTTPAPTGSSASTTAAPSSTKPGGGTTVKPSAPEVTDAQATQLCDMIRPVLSDWRVQGPTLGKLQLNALVIEWRVRTGALQADKPTIDRITTKSCPDVRQQAIEALEIPDLASGLVL